MHLHFWHLVSVSILFCTQQTIGQSHKLVLENINVVDVESGIILRTRTVEIDSGIITAIKKQPRKNYPPNTLVVTANDKYLIPGLWDMHVHITQGPWNDPTKTFALMIANGITGIREMGGFIRTINQWRSQISKGALLGPRIMAAGPILYGNKTVDLTHIGVSSPERARQIVDSLKAIGIDLVKVYNFIPREPYYAIADAAKKLKIPLAGHVPLSVSLAEASDAGQNSIEHLNFPFFVQECAREFTRWRKKDIDREYHLTRPFDPASTSAWIEQIHDFDSALMQYEQKRADTIYNHFLKNHTWQCPTLIFIKMSVNRRDSTLTTDSLMKYAYSSFTRKQWDYKNAPISAAMNDEEWNILKRLYSKNLQIVNDMKKRSIAFLAGTDLSNAFIYPGFSLHEELELFVQTGFTPMEALQTATINPARFFGLEDSLGTIMTGKYADLVILNANPLIDISNTRRIEGIVVLGKYYNRNQLDRLLESVIVKK